MRCTVEDCDNIASFKYTWAWGEEGACCSAHRAHLESKAAQLAREIAFETLSGDTTLREYKAPALTRLSPEVGQLRLRIAELQQKSLADEATIAQLEEQIERLRVELGDAIEAKPGPTLSVVEGERPPTTPPPHR